MDKIKIKSMISSLLVDDIDNARRVFIECIESRIAERNDALIKSIITTLEEADNE